MTGTPDHRAGRAAEAKRLIGLERRYACRSCDSEHRSWSRLRACPACGEPLAVAVIRRAAVVAA
jgi:predicted amidophosphoribosyltransferase